MHTGLDLRDPSQTETNMSQIHTQLHQVSAASNWETLKTFSALWKAASQRRAFATRILVVDLDAIMRRKGHGRKDQCSECRDFPKKCRELGGIAEGAPRKASEAVTKRPRMKPYNSTPS